MKLKIPTLAAAIGVVFLLAGCHDGSSPAPVPAAGTAERNSGAQVLATIGPDNITINEISPILVEGYGLNVLLKYVQLDLARQLAAKDHVVVTDADIAHEREMMMQAIIRKAEDQSVAAGGAAATRGSDFSVSPQEADELLDRALAMQQVSRAEFDHVILEMQATLRKIAEPTVAPKITDAAVHDYFNQTYGGKAAVRYIVSANMQDAQKIEQAVAQGKSFDDAALMIGQKVRDFVPFTKLDEHVPQVIRDVAFTMKPGDVSDPVQVSDQSRTAQYILVLKLVELTPPQHARFEDYADSSRQEFHDQQMTEEMKKIYTHLGQLAMQDLKITDPVLLKQWDQRQAANGVQSATSADVRRQLDEARAAEAAAATMPTAPAATSPESAAATTQSSPVPATAPSTGQ